MIPYNINYKSYTRDTFKQIRNNIINSFKNYAAYVSGSFLKIFNFLYPCFCRLSTLSSSNAIPGVTTLHGKSLVQKIRDLKKLFGTQSVKPDSLVAPFRQMALDLYMQINDATAKFVIRTFSTFLFVFSLSTSSDETRRIL